MSVEEWARKLMEIIDAEESSPKNKLDALSLFATYTFNKPSTKNVDLKVDVNKKLDQWVKGDIVEWEDTDRTIDVDIS